MSKIKKYVLLFAGLVTAFTGFTACASSDEVNDDLPDQAEERGVVKTQFTISIPMEAKGATRQGADIVQDKGLTDFRGINQICLFSSNAVSYNKDEDEPDNIDKETPVFTTTAPALTGLITLSQMLKPTAQTANNIIPKNAGLWANSKSVLYNDVSINLGTKTFLFYGKAIDNIASETSLSTSQDKFKFGTLNVTGMEASSTSAAGFTFSPAPILSVASDKMNTNDDPGYAKRTALSEYLKTIAGSTAEGKTWAEATSTSVKALYDKFITMTAGSSANIQAAIEDLYFTLKGSTDPMAVAICTNIEASSDVTIVNTPKTDSDPAVRTLTFSGDLAGYPAVYNLPDGAAAIRWNSTDKTFDFVDSNAAIENVTPIGKFVYPANLYYWGISNILTSEAPQEGNFDESKTWDANATTGIFNYYTDGESIASKTRSVILKKQIQYGVGRFDIKVVGSATSIPDNGNNTKDGELFVKLSDLKLTGVLIAKQNSVGWNFAVKGTEDYTIYDNIAQRTTDGKGLSIDNKSLDNASYLNYTLVLETPGANDETLKVALEFVNNGPDFWGSTGIVPTGTKFYLVGELDFKKGTKPTGYTDNKIFKQDWITIARFQIKDLKTALNVIPDLRNPNMELGLSVDLTWNTGISFDISIGGSN